MATSGGAESITPLPAAANEEEEEEDDDELRPLPGIGEEEPIEQATVHRNEQDSMSFSRLDPNRRSFSSPQVNLTQPTTKTQKSPTTTVTQQAATNKLRRRTALGLISLGSAHFRLAKQHSQELPSNKTNQQTGRNWRAWFTGGARWSSASLAERPAGGRRFLLRSLRPQTSPSAMMGAATATAAEATGEPVVDLEPTPGAGAGTGTGTGPERGQDRHREREEESGHEQEDAEQMEPAPATGTSMGAHQSLVDRLIDSQLEWRRLINEANGDRWQLERELGELQIKRQELVHELIQTERHHCLTLALMRQVYLNGLRRLNEARSRTLKDQNQQQHHQADLIDLERLFPALEELVQAHELFFAHLRLRLVEACRRQAPPLGLVGPIGELLRDQFRLGQASFQGQKLLQAYAKFCGHHHDSNRYYKQLMQSDKGFKQFIEQCNKQNPCCRQRGIPECNLLVTQRLTKYPLLIEQLIKTSKDEPEEEANLRLALQECKALLNELNNQLARKESFERLLDIYAHFSPKSTTSHLNNPNFTKHDLLQHKRLRQLLHSDGQLRLWSAQRRKLVQVLCLILNDIVVFLRLESAPSQPAASATTASQPQLEQCAGSELAAPGAEQESGLWQHQNQLQLPLGGQCALLNAAYHHYHHLSALNLGPSDRHHHQQQQQQQQQQPQPHQQSSDGGRQSGNAVAGGFSVKYYFANIDNKSSVISLSKLLVREKAAGGDPEPRLYLISSSQRQPEMYELAFVSRRHQASFVDKLKGSIEQHNRNLAAYEEEDDDEEEQNEAEDELIEFGQHCHLEAPCLCDGNDDDDDDDDQDDELGDSSNDADEDEETTGSQVNANQNETFCTASSELEAAPFGLLIEQELPASHQMQDERDQEEEEEADEAERLGESHESGLSERAKDSLDEASAETMAPRHKLRGGRRRRQQRPRQVSNQSSSSSEAAHRQALQLISGGDQMKTNQAAGSEQHDTGETTEEFDSGRGHDDSSSSVSTSSNSLPPAVTTPINVAKTSLSSSSANHHDKEAQDGKRRADEHKLVTIGHSHSSASSETSQFNGNNSVGLLKCGSSSVKGAKSSKNCCVKHRKLSTVSTMSSQLKLISKLKSGLESQLNLGANIDPSTCCCCCSRQGVLSGQQQQQQRLSSCPISQQSTLSKQVRQQMRRSSFVPEQKLEELRDLMIQLDKDKQEWQAKFDRMQEQLLDERRELDLAREKLKRDQQQVANEREQLYRKLDVLKEKGILLSPSHKVIITTPELRNQHHTQHLDQQHYHQHQLQLVNSNNNNNINNNHRSSSVQIQIQSQSQRQQQQQYLGHRQPLTDVAQNNNYLQQQQRAGSTSLFIEGVKVPLHLAENGSSVQQQHQQQKQKLASLGLSKVPQIGSPSNSLLAQRFGFGAKNGGSFKLESQVI